MRTREETKANIRRKSAARLAERAWRRRAALSAACVVLMLGSADALWLWGSLTNTRGTQSSGDDSLIMGAAPLEGEYAGGAMENGYGAERDMPTQEGERVDDADDRYSAYNAAYAAPDSMRIYTLPHAREVSFSAQNADEQAIIAQMSDWISALDVTKARGGAEDSAVTYVIERRYGENVATVYVQGGRVKFEGGEWLTVSAEDEKAFQTMMGKILE